MLVFLELRSFALLSRVCYSIGRIEVLDFQLYQVLNTNALETLSSLFQSLFVFYSYYLSTYIPI
jgi:hypothetical protein